MKYTLIILFFFTYLTAHALPCPNGQGIIYKGDTIATVLMKCGQPNQTISRTQNINFVQEWIYYQPHWYSAGYTQISLFVYNNFISRIHIYDQNYSGICGQTVSVYGNLITTQFGCGNIGYDTALVNMCGSTFAVGDSIQAVVFRCGAPALQNPIQSYAIDQTEFIYLTNPPQTIIFQNGSLIDWQ